MPKKEDNLIEPIGLEDSVRYGEKLTYDGKRLPDPYYQIKEDEWSGDLSSVPCITFPDIYVYCVLKTAFYTNEDVKAYRSLQAHNYFENGFVQTIKTTAAGTGNSMVFMKADVLASQRVGVKNIPYKAWVLLKKAGQIMTAHCTCMAG